jgi:hypothetical protein
MNKYFLIVVIIALMVGFRESQPVVNKSYYVYYLCGTNPMQKFKELAKAIGFFLLFIQNSLLSLFLNILNHFLKIKIKKVGNRLI